MRCIQTGLHNIGRSWTRILLCLLLISFGIGIIPLPVLAQEYSTREPDPSVSTAQTVDVAIPSDEVDYFRLFTEIKDLILQYSTENPSKKTLYQGAIDGLLQAINDPYSAYMTPEEFENLSSSLEGEYVGIGVTIEAIGGNITVVSTFNGSPAEKAGIKAGDIITSVDDEDLRGKSLQEVSLLLRGTEGTTVSVTVKRPSTGETYQFQVKRARIVLPTIELKDMGDQIYYIAITQFTDQTAREFPVVIDFLRLRGLKGLILDLRNNPGGLLDACVEVAKSLVPKGPIVELRTKNAREVIENDEDITPVPVAVLVNKGTASASEILAGAIKDRGVGILVGESTFGKACVQAVVPLGSEMGGIKLTIADYYTPNGTNISGEGLQPDVLVAPEKIVLPSEISYKRAMKKGLVGLDVLALQENLMFLGYDSGEPDGIFGPLTEKALETFCEDHNLSYNGQVDQTIVDAIQDAVSQKIANLPDKVLEAGLNALRKRISTGVW